MNEETTSYVKLYQKSIESEVFQNDALWKLFCWCLMKASHKDEWIAAKTGTGTTQVKVKRSQFIFTRKQAAPELRMAETSVRDRMKKLEEMGNISIQSATHYSIVTVCNWDAYQVSGFNVRHPAATQPPPRFNGNGRPKPSEVSMVLQVARNESMTVPEADKKVFWDSKFSHYLGISASAARRLIGIDEWNKILRK